MMADDRPGVESGPSPSMRRGMRISRMRELVLEQGTGSRLRRDNRKGRLRLKPTEIRVRNRSVTSAVPPRFAGCAQSVFPVLSPLLGSRFADHPPAAVRPFLPSRGRYRHGCRQTPLQTRLVGCSSVMEQCGPASRCRYVLRGLSTPFAISFCSHASVRRQP